MGLPTGSPTFDQHLGEDHSMWSYLFYIYYLRKKDETEYNGIESFVSTQLESGALDWVPTKTSFVLELHGKSGANSSGASDESTKTNFADKLDAAARVVTGISKTWKERREESSGGQERFLTN